MENVNIVSELIERLTGLLLEFERLTRILNECEAETMADYITNRDNLANDIKAVQKEIDKACERAGGSPSAEAIVKNRCSFVETPDEWKRVYQMGQQIKLMLSRIIDADKLAVKHAEQVRDYYKSRLADMKSTSRVIQYLSSSGAIQQERGSATTSKRI